MLLRTAKSELNGIVSIPGSKSHTVRALAFGLLGDGISTIRNPLDSGDTRSALSAVRGFGAHIEINSSWQVNGLSGKLQPAANIIDVKNSGTTLYIAMGLASLAQGYTVLTGDNQIRNRPADNLLQAINDLGGNAFSTRHNGCAPLVVGGVLRGGRTVLESPTSQYLTSLLIAAVRAEKDTVIEVPLLNEKPYIQMTLAWLDYLGIECEYNEELSFFKIKAGQKYPAFERSIPGDFSSATFFLCAAAIAGQEVVLEGLDLADTQGDKAVIGYLEEMGAKIEKTDAGLKVSATQLQGAELDLNATPDALPALAVTACFARGTTKLLNVPQARLKETDRLSVMFDELSALGAVITELEDGLIIEESVISGGRVHGHADHRVVMALSLAGLRSEKAVEVSSAEAVAVTFPDFADKMAAIGADIGVILD